MARLYKAEVNKHINLSKKGGFGIIRDLIELYRNRNMEKLERIASDPMQSKHALQHLKGYQKQKHRLQRQRAVKLSIDDSAVIGLIDYFEDTSLAGKSDDVPMVKVSAKKSGKSGRDKLVRSKLNMAGDAVEVIATSAAKRANSEKRTVQTDRYGFAVGELPVIKSTSFDKL